MISKKGYKIIDDVIQFSIELFVPAFLVVSSYMAGATGNDFYCIYSGILLGCILFTFKYR